MACTVPYYNAVGLTAPPSNQAEAAPGSIFFQQIQVNETIAVSAIALYPLVSSDVASTSPILNITVALYSGASGFLNNLSLIRQSGPVVVTNFSTFTQQNVVTPLLFTVPTAIISAGAYNVVFWFTWNVSTFFYQSSFGIVVTGPPPLYYIFPDLNGGISYTTNQGILPPQLYTSSNQVSGNNAPGAVVSLVSNCSSSISSSTGQSNHVFSSSTGNNAATTQSISILSLLAIILAVTYNIGF
jgi:hypothetical protein